MSDRSWRDIGFQAIATALIPLTIAGMGWYYTRWQQNLNDLKTMIDLVTDDSKERRKYGIAMFEYLLRNDKVPAEFLSAQLDFANTSADRDLLMLMEVAIQKASENNTNVAPIYREAVSRLPSRLFVHVLDEGQRACVRQILGGMKDVDKRTLVVPGIWQVADWGGEANEIRFLTANDAERASQLAGLFGSMGLDVTVKDLSASYADARNVRPNTFELWLGHETLPARCALAAAGD